MVVAVFGVNDPTVNLWPIRTDCMLERDGESARVSQQSRRIQLHGHCTNFVGEPKNGQIH